MRRDGREVLKLDGGCAGIEELVETTELSPEDSAEHDALERAAEEEMKALWAAESAHRVEAAMKRAEARWKPRVGDAVFYNYRTAREQFVTAHAEVTKIIDPKHIEIRWIVETKHRHGTRNVLKKDSVLVHKVRKAPAFTSDQTDAMIVAIVETGKRAAEAEKNVAVAEAALQRAKESKIPLPVSDLPDDEAEVILEQEVVKEERVASIARGELAKGGAERHPVLYTRMENGKLPEDVSSQELCKLIGLPVTLPVNEGPLGGFPRSGTWLPEVGEEVWFLNVERGRGGTYWIRCIIRNRYVLSRCVHVAWVEASALKKATKVRLRERDIFLDGPYGERVKPLRRDDVPLTGLQYNTICKAAGLTLIEKPVDNKDSRGKDASISSRDAVSSLPSSDNGSGSRSQESVG